MPPLRRPRQFGILFFHLSAFFLRTSRAGLLCLAVGCGAAEYEGRMLDAQARLARYDEEARLLDDRALAMPTREDKEGAHVRIANVFLRPPKGIGSQPSKEPRLGLLYSYQPRENTASTAAQVELAFSDQKEFKTNLIRCFNTTTKPTERKRSFRQPGREAPLTFDTTEFEDDRYFYSINVWGDGKTQVAVVYWLFKNQASAASRAMDLSLENFGSGADADRQSALFNRGSPLKQVPQ
jgi:hypothetical protein